MPDQDTIDGLLVGAIDAHVHSAPDVLPGRLLDNGFSEAEVSTMVRNNATQLLGARVAAAA